MGVFYLLPLRCPHEDADLAGLFGQTVVDVGDDGEGGALWVAEANIDPVISETQQTQQCSTDSAHRKSYYHTHTRLFLLLELS